MGQHAVIEVLAQVVVLIVVHIHVHLDVVGPTAHLLQDVGHAADNAVAAPVIVIGIEAVQTGKKGGNLPGCGAVSLGGRQIEELRHPHIQGRRDVVQGGQIHRDLAVFILGYTGFALADGLSQLVDGHLSIFTIVPNFQSDFTGNIHKKPLFIF